MNFRSFRFATRNIQMWLLLVIAFGWAPSLATSDDTGQAELNAERTVTIRLNREVTSRPETGRMYLVVTDEAGVEPRTVTSFTFAYYMNNTSVFPYAPFFGQDVEQMEPGSSIVMEGAEAGFPFRKLTDLPSGDYYVQAVLHKYEQVTPPHGKTIWLPMDDWEGTQFHLSPGNFCSDVHPLKVVDGGGIQLELELDQVIPPPPPAEDTEYAKFLKFKSELASEFWGRDIHVGINVILPKGYHDNPDARYPVVFHMGHFCETTPMYLPTSEPPETASPPPMFSPRWTWEQWMSDETPRFIAVTLMHPTPYYDDSYFVNSANTGPWQDVLIQEMLPRLDAEFRTISEPWARVMFGGSTGGWISLYTQITCPESFGGAWVFCPDMVDFRELVSTDMYREQNYYVPDDSKWMPSERPYARSLTGRTRVTARQFGMLCEALGSRCRSGEWIDAYAAMFGNVGEDGYPIPLIDWTTGEIDNDVAKSWPENGFDLRHFMEENWSTLGPKVRGQLWFLCGDMDEYFCNTALYLLEDFLKTTDNPPYDGSFRWGRPKVGHTYYDLGLDPWPFAMLDEMANHIKGNSPDDFDHSHWYPTEQTAGTTRD